MLNNEHESTESTESQGLFQKSQATERISRIILLLPNTDFGCQSVKCQILQFVLFVPPLGGWWFNYSVHSVN